MHDVHMLRVARHLHSRRRHFAVGFCDRLGTDAVRILLSTLLLDVLIVVYHSSWSFYVPLFGTLINLGLLYWKRHSHPLNFVLLSTFTAMEAFTLGVMVAFFDNLLVLQALYVIVSLILTCFLTAGSTG